jgi:hypothetical protein
MGADQGGAASFVINGRSRSDKSDLDIKGAIEVG